MAVGGGKTGGAGEFYRGFVVLGHGALVACPEFHGAATEIDTRRLDLKKQHRLEVVPNEEEFTAKMAHSGRSKLTDGDQIHDFPRVELAGSGDSTHSGASGGEICGSGDTGETVARADTAVAIERFRSSKFYGTETSDVGNIRIRVRGIIFERGAR